MFSLNRLWEIVNESEYYDLYKGDKWRFELKWRRRQGIWPKAPQPIARELKRRYVS